jgi:DNA-binding CsgD family transcriptional regulator
MKGRIAQPWTPSEDERLRKLAAEGRSSLTIAERLKRTPKSIRNRAKKLKIVLVKVQGSFRE